MMILKLKFLTAALTISLCGIANAQIPVEGFAGHKKTTADIMFFRYFRDRNEKNTDWLFFNRNRASVDYKMTTSSNLPQFGFTEAVSYNHKKWNGFAPVAVIQLLNRGVYPKAGLQYARIRNSYTVFTWVVSETLNHPDIDWFFLGRYTPAISEKLHLFTQLELINAFPTNHRKNYSYIQRIRLGLKIQDHQFGVGADLTSLGRSRFTTTTNIGVFLRNEF